MTDREEVKRIREMYPKGTLVRLESMSGEPQMPCGMKGRVQLVDDIGQIHVSWENGSSLPLHVAEDEFRIITQEENVTEQKQADEVPEEWEAHCMNGPN